MEDQTTQETNRIMLSFLALVSATSIGFICGLLLAPESGTRTRRKLHNMALDTRERVDEWTEDAKDTVEQFVKEGKKVVGA